MSDPTLLVCDEPTGDLDRQSAAEVLGLLQQLNREHGKTIIMVTHDPKAAEYATHTLHLDKGTLVDAAAGDRVKYLPLVLGALFRRKTRTVFTLLSVLAAFLLFGMLDSVRSAFANATEDVAGVDRLVVFSKISFTMELPKSLLERISALPGVSQVTYANWFGGIYQDPKNFFPNEAVAPNFLDLYPEWRLSAAERAAFRNTRTGCGGRPAARGPLSLEGRRQDSAAGDDLSAEERQQRLDAGSGRHLSRGRSPSRRPRKMRCSSTGITSTSRARLPTARSAGTSSR